MSAPRVKTLLLLHVLLLFYSFSDVASKMAAGNELFSLGFFLFYGLVLAILVVYALGWQQVIKRIPLTTAYGNRGITVVWGLFWGVVFFGEQITLFKVVGAAMIIVGIALFSRADAELGLHDDAEPDAQDAAGPRDATSSQGPAEAGDGA